MEEHILANAALVRTFAADHCDSVVAYDEAGVRWLAGYIEGPAQCLDEATKKKMISMFGSFLGECIRQTYGGQWVQDPEQGWTMQINARVSVYPFNKVQKHLDKEDGDSVLGLFTTIGPILAGLPAGTLAPAVVLTPEPQVRREPGLTPAPGRAWWKFW